MRSVRIEQFRAEATDDPAAATARLAVDLRAARGPLVEPAGDGQMLVTFVWIGPQQQVSVRGAQLFADRNAISHPMTRIDGTDVWFRSVVAPAGVSTVYQYLIDDPFLTADHTDLALLGRLMAEARDRSYADPVNPNRIFPQAAMIAGVETAPEDRWDTVLELPGMEPVDWFDGEPAGTFTEHRLASARLGNERRVTVYLPAGVPAGPYPLVILLDGETWLTVARLPVALDRLTSSGRIAPLAVAFVHNPPDAMAARMREMSCEPDFAAMLADELLPLLRAAHDLAPGPVTVGGNSLGGLAAAHAAYERPDAFGAVLSCSGAFWWGYAPGGQGWGRDDEPEWLNAFGAVLSCSGAFWWGYAPGGQGWGRDDEPEWLTRRYASTPRRPVRFALDVGTLETGASPLSPGVDQRAANRHLRTVLLARGYEVHYREAPGGHDFATFRRSVVHGLRTLFGTA